MTPIEGVFDLPEILGTIITQGYQRAACDHFEDRIPHVVPAVGRPAGTSPRGLPRFGIGKRALHDLYISGHRWVTTGERYLSQMAAGYPYLGKGACLRANGVSVGVTVHRAGWLRVAGKERRTLLVPGYGGFLSRRGCRDSPRSCRQLSRLGRRPPPCQWLYWPKSTPGYASRRGRGRPHGKSPIITSRVTTALHGEATWFRTSLLRPCGAECRPRSVHRSMIAGPRGLRPQVGWWTSTGLERLNEQWDTAVNGRPLRQGIKVECLDRH